MVSTSLSVMLVGESRQKEHTVQADWWTTLVLHTISHSVRRLIKSFPSEIGLIKVSGCWGGHSLLTGLFWFMQQHGEVTLRFTTKMSKLQNRRQETLKHGVQFGSLLCTNMHTFAIQLPVNDFVWKKMFHLAKLSCMCYFYTCLHATEFTAQNVIFSIILK